MFSYTWSRLWGNYTGLTTTDQIDGGTTGRNSPDTTRSFDEPFYYFGANGKSNEWAVADRSSKHLQGQRVLPAALEGDDHNLRTLPGCLPGQPGEFLHRHGLVKRR